MHMKPLQKKEYFQITGYLFVGVAILHGLRAFNEWELMYNDWEVPLWLSWVVVVGVLYLAYSAFKLQK